MPESDVWPPKPDLPDPLTEYDEVIAAKIVAMPTGNPAQMRFRLIKELREDGLELKQAMAVVKSYGMRHGAFVPTRASQIFAWGNFGLAIAPFALSVFNMYLYS